ncbi:MAG: membrane protein insertase YidC [Gemmatimonadota bacterium]|nr:MAG: membrane protein insertase YidC [Gemmatimonadota bacterium]
MNQESRFVLAISLMILVLVGTNILFPPIPPEEIDVPGTAADSSALTPATGTERPPLEIPSLPEVRKPAAATTVVEDAPAARDVVVQGPLYRFTFSSRGANLTSAVLTEFLSFAEDGRNEDGLVELIPPGSGALGSRIQVGQNVLDLTDQPFEVVPSGGLNLREGGPPQMLTFTYRHPTTPFVLSTTYTFEPDSYLVYVSTRIEGIDADLLLTDLGTGIAYNEDRVADESRALAYVTNHLQNGIRAQRLEKVDESEIVPGPFVWAAIKSKYFLFVIMPGADAGTTDYLGGLIAEPVPAADQAYVAVTQPVGSAGVVEHRLLLAPQNRALLTSFENDLEDVNPYGWRWMRPIVRPFVGIVLGILDFLHDRLNVGYGWVLILFGVMMRVLLFPLNQKAMRAQMKNMAVQPLLQEIQAKYKDQPEKLQKEMMKLYKDHGFNPVAGCLPMLLPWPILITLFFVFQNTIDLRGEPFLWLPSLSAADPLYILPVVLGLSMFLMQWITVRSMETPNPQMKMMMWLMPGFMMFIFLNLASGLNLYYATANLTTLPQQYWIAKERQKLHAAQRSAKN